MDCNIEVSKFETHSSYYIYFWKGMKHLFPLSLPF